MRIVVATDKFKGTLSAAEAAGAMAEGARAANPGAEVVIAPVADGGEGTVDAILAARDGRLRTMAVTGPLGVTVEAPVARVSDEYVVVESASACGLALIEAPDALRASSTGAGDLIRGALDEQPASMPIFLGVGGTASTDGGTGAATAIGWRFLDRRGKDLPPGGASLALLDAIDPGRVDDRVAQRTITAVCDVSNRLTGARGAARAFGPQKGASAEDVDALERGLDRLAEVIARDLGVDVSTIPHGGAGGGLGAGLVAFFGAELTAGFDWLASTTRLAATIDGADVVLTGEGRVDESSGEGKVVSGVAALALNAGARCFVVAGEVHDRSWLPEAVRCVDLAARYGPPIATREAKNAAADRVRAVVAELLST